MLSMNYKNKWVILVWKPISKKQLDHSETRIEVTLVADERNLSGAEQYALWLF